MKHAVHPDESWFLFLRVSFTWNNRLMTSRSEKWVLTAKSFQQQGETWGGGNVDGEKMKVKKVCKLFQGYRRAWHSGLALWATLTQPQTLSLTVIKGKKCIAGLLPVFSTSPKSSGHTGSGQLLILSSSSYCWPWSYTLYLLIVLLFSPKRPMRTIRSGSPAGSFLSCPLNIRHPNLFLALQPKFLQVKRKRSPGQVIF